MTSLYSDNEFVCTNCGAFASELHPNTGWCYTCSPIVTVTKVEIALAANADAIEHFTSTSSVTIWEALRLAQSDRPTCVVCGERISRAPRNAIFCRRTQECRRYSRRYVYLYRERGFTKVEALAQIFVELTGET